jgi:hypothetical protein
MNIADIHQDHDDSPNPGPSRAGSGSSEPAASNEKSNEEPHKVRGRNVNSVQVVEKNEALVRHFVKSQLTHRCSYTKIPINSFSFPKGALDALNSNDLAYGPSVLDKRDAILAVISRAL